MTNPNFEEDELLKKLVLNPDSLNVNWLTGAVTYAIYRRKLEELITEKTTPEQKKATIEVLASICPDLEDKATIILSDYAKAYSKKDLWYGVWQSIVGSIIFSVALFSLAFIVRLSKPDSGIGVVIQYLFSNGEYEIRPKTIPSKQPSRRIP